MSFARDKEAGTRLLISHYISHAIIQVKTHFHLSSIVSFPEYHIGPEEIPNLGWIHGNLDFAVAKILIEDGDTIGNSHTIKRLMRNREYHVEAGR